ncbi:hypothetical protein L226DRAFT_228479 [Lentinus tigrinus ALCF2SS1-7]|uniref:uncharacterized protein n=1 Tax=Lentinus tigrinus ALCF2SS1-7 TaxID=1328758 RepID=UPI001165F4A9|nr:hypothetical protein L226DRAFT_228479 [Lentinus tigrinus ALCF2SS1-7]
MEAEERRELGVLGYRQDVIAAASTLMSHTALAEVRTCVSDGESWMFGCLRKRPDGRRAYLDMDYVQHVEDVPSWSSSADHTFRSRLGVVVGMLAGWVSAVHPH